MSCCSTYARSSGFFFYMFLAVLVAKTSFCFSTKVWTWFSGSIFVLGCLKKQAKSWNLDWFMAVAGLCGVHGKQKRTRPRWYSESQPSNACICSQWKVRELMPVIFIGNEYTVAFSVAFFSFFLIISEYVCDFPFFSCRMFWLNSVEQAQASHVYSYRHGFRGFAAKLTDEQAYQISSQWKFSSTQCSITP